MDLELDFTLHLGCEKTPFKTKPINNPSIIDLNLESSLFSAPPESDVHFSPPNANKTGSTKACQFDGCGKGARARGASGLCISHGGGRRCQKPGCHKGAEGRTVFCKAHGGGRRCEFLGCTKSSEGRTDYCMAHGGGRRCIRHGGGKRCSWGHRACNAFARGKTGLCISHGALVKDKRVHGGATFGTLVHETSPTLLQKPKEMLFSREVGFSFMPFGMQHKNVVAGSRPLTGEEGRVHGGSMISLLAARGSGS